MSIRRRGKVRKSVVALSIAILVALGAGVALATPMVGSRLEFLGRGTVADRIKVHTRDVKLQTKGPVDFLVNRLTIEPGGHTGWHSHPGPNLVTIQSGTVTTYDADCSARTYTAGQAFVDPGNHVHIMRNSGSGQAVLLVTSILPVGAQLRIDEPAPAVCL